MELPQLTARKLAIVIRLSEGDGYKQIAARFGIAEATVRVHVMEIAARLPAPPYMPPRDKVLLFCDRLLTAQRDAPRAA